ncbi:MAG: hypothetical protein Q9225_000199 [Loekoesia sp. 1 TL-2023]
MAKPLRISYRTGRRFLTYEPYKSALVPHWKFRSVAQAKASSQTLWSKFLEYEKEDDFMGMDMARKYIQLGMTRAKRSANFNNDRRENNDEEGGKELERRSGRELKEEKKEASRLFREVWEKCRAHEGYKIRKEAWVREKWDWKREMEAKEKERLRARQQR